MNKWTNKRNLLTILLTHYWCNDGQNPCWLKQFCGWATQGQWLVSEGGLIPWLPSTLWRQVCFHRHRSFYNLLVSLHTQFHLLCLAVLSPFPAYTASLPVSMLLVRESTYSFSGCLGQFLSSFFPVFQVILFGLCSRMCLFFLKTSLLVQLLLST